MTNVNDRDVVFHAHIFKNAGTTIDWILQNNFGDRFRDDRNDQEILKRADYLEELLRDKPALRAVSSHSLPLPLVNIEGIRAHVIVMLRNPILRVRSVYNFERKQKAKTPGALMAKELNFKEYVAWRLQPEVNATIRNMQVSYLTRNIKGLNRNQMDTKRLSAALEVVENNQLIGIVERFDNSMVIFQDYFKDSPIPINFAYKKQNVTDSSKDADDIKLSKLKKDLGSDLFEALYDHNKFDIELYEHSLNLHQQRFDLIVNRYDHLSTIRLGSTVKND